TRFRMPSDDDVQPWTIAPASVPCTLSLAQLRDLIVSASRPAWPDDAWPLDHGLRDGVSRPRARLFVIVQSACYPDLSGLFDDRAREWVEGQAAPGGSDA